MIASVGRSQGGVVKSKADLCNQDAKGKAEKGHTNTQRARTHKHDMKAGSRRVICSATVHSDETTASSVSPTCCRASADGARLCWMIITCIHAGRTTDHTPVIITCIHAGDSRMQVTQPRMHDTKSHHRPAQDRLSSKYFSC